MATKDIYPDSRPALILDFERSRRLDPRITFTGGGGTRTNALGLIEVSPSGKPRFDHDPITLACKGLLVEEARTNLFTYSEQFDNAAWAKSACTVTANATTAPDGTLTADKLVEDTTTSVKYVLRNSNVNITAGLTYTASFYIKDAGRSTLILAMSTASFGDSVATIDLTAMTAVKGGAAPPIAATCIDAGNGWRRVSVTATATVSVATSPAAVIRLNTNSPYLGDGVSGIYVWGAQLEETAPFATSYIPTAASQVTRVADSASITGANFSNWFNQNEGSFITSVIANNYAITGVQVRMFLSVGNGQTLTSQEAYQFGRGAGFAIRAQLTNAGVTPATPAAAVAFGTIAADQTDKFAAGYSAAVPTLTLNGVQATPITSGYTKPATVDRMMLGMAHNTTLYNYILNGHIKRITYYATRLTDAQLQVLTQ